MLGENESETLAEPKFGENDNGNVALCQMDLHVGIEPNLNLTHSHNVRLKDDLDGLSEDDIETDSNISIDNNCL